MQRKFRILGILLCLSLMFVSCAKTGTKTQSAETDNKAVNAATLIPDVMTSENGKYEIGFCHSTGGIKDGGFSEGTYNGIKLFAKDNGLTYKYYGNKGASSTDEDFYDSLKAAVMGGAKVVLCVGFNYANPLARIAPEYPDVKFITIDGNPVEGCNNVVGISFKDQECGFLAGYSAVRDGFTKLGFSGGGGGTNDAVNRYGYGYVQGAEMAAAELGVQVEMNYSFQYGANYSSSPELQAMCNAWYENGTEVIFSVGGSMLNSVASAAANNDGWVIAPDSDMAYKSRTILTSALKRVDIAAYYALAAVYEGEWDTIGGQLITLSAKEGTVGLPTENWRFRRFTIPEYEEILQKMVDDEIVVDGDFKKLKSTEHVHVREM